MFIVPNKGERSIAQMAFMDAASPAVKIELCIDARTTILETEDETNFTKMHTLGYAAITLARADGSVSTDSGGNTYWEHAPITFTFTAGTRVDVISWMAVRADNNDIIGGEIFPYAIPCAQLNDVVVVKPRIKVE